MKRQKLFLIPLILSILLYSCLSCTYAETEYFERGDLLFREKEIGHYRHTGIYYHWDGENSPEEKLSHKILEAPGRISGVWEKTYGYFYNLIPDGYRGAGTLYLTAEEREQIVVLAYDRLNYKYALRQGYKDRLIDGEFFKTYRCDGLAEHCYEIALGNYGIIYDPGWTYLTPKKQQEAMIPDLWDYLPYIDPDSINPPLGVKPKVSIKKPSADEMLADLYSLEAGADDGDYGSGIAQVEFWAGGLDSTPDNITETGVKLGTDPHKVLIKGDYSLPWNTASEALEGEAEFPDAYYLIFAKAFDQAGNTRVSEPVRVIVNNTPPRITNVAPTGSLTGNKRPTVSCTIVSEDGVVPIDLSSITLSLDGSTRSHTAHPIGDGCSVAISYTPAFDLTAGQHTVTVNAKDTSGLEASQKTWSFEIIEDEPNLRAFLYINLSGGSSGDYHFNLRCPASSERKEVRVDYLVMDYDTFEIVWWEDVTDYAWLEIEDTSVARLTYEWVYPYGYKVFVEPIALGHTYLSAQYCAMFPLPIPTPEPPCVVDSVLVIVGDSISYGGELTGTISELIGTTTRPGCDGTTVSFNLYGLSTLEGSWEGSYFNRHCQYHKYGYKSISQIDPAPGSPDPPYEFPDCYEKPISETPEPLSGYFEATFFAYTVGGGQMINGYAMSGQFNGKEQGTFEWIQEDADQDGTFDIWRLHTTSVKATGYFRIKFAKPIH